MFSVLILLWFLAATIWLAPYSHPKFPSMPWQWILPLSLVVFFTAAHIFWLHHPFGTFAEFIYEQGAYQAMLGMVPFRDFMFRHGVLFPYFNGIIEHNFGWVALKSAYLAMGLLGWEIFRRYIVKLETQINADLFLLFHYTFPITLTFALFGQNEFLILPFIYGALLLPPERCWWRGILLGLGFCIGTVMVAGFYIGLFCLMRTWRQIWRTALALIITILLINLPFILQGGYFWALSGEWNDLILGTFSTVWGVIIYWGGKFPEWLPPLSLGVAVAFLFLFSRRFPPVHTTSFLTAVFVGFTSFNTQMHIDHCLLIFPLLLAWLSDTKWSLERFFILGWLLMILAQLLQELFGPKGLLAPLVPPFHFFPGIYAPLMFSIIIVFQLGTVLVGLLRNLPHTPTIIVLPETSKSA